MNWFDEFDFLNLQKFSDAEGVQITLEEFNQPIIHIKRGERLERRILLKSVSGRWYPGEVI